MLQTLNFAGARQIDAKASFFRFETCNASGADESIRVRADGSDLGLFLPGDHVDLPVFATRWEVIPTTASATGTVRLGAGKVGSSRLTGSVKVIDQGADKTATGNQFIGSLSGAALVGNGSLAGIRATSKTVSVKALCVSSSIAGLAAVWFSTGRPTVNPVFFGIGSNKLSGAASSTAEAIYGNSAATTPTSIELPGGYSAAIIQLSANVPYQIPLTTPITLTVGRALLICSNALNRDVLFYVDFEES